MGSCGVGGSLGLGSCDADISLAAVGNKREGERAREEKNTRQAAGKWRLHMQLQSRGRRYRKDQMKLGERRSATAERKSGGRRVAFAPASSFGRAHQAEPATTFERAGRGGKHPLSRGVNSFVGWMKQARALPRTHARSFACACSLAPSLPPSLSFSLPLVVPLAPRRRRRRFVVVRCQTTTSIRPTRKPHYIEMHAKQRIWMCGRFERRRCCCCSPARSPPSLCRSRANLSREKEPQRLQP